MKTLIIHRIALLFILTMGWITAKGQQWEVPGDHFSLEGALELFKESNSPEAFERMLNDPEARINNLDLNGDGYIDYIRVIDYYEGNVHAFVLQAVISEYQNQDVAVITLEKLANGRAILQITGDADIYGVETIIEPTREVRTYAGTRSSRVIVNVWAWPMVRYVYGPHYRVWVSPWGWHARPYWYRPWRPVVYHDYYAFWSPYRSYYSIAFTHRIVYAHRIYRPYRTTSVIVYNRHHHRIRHYRSTYITRDGYHQPREDRYRRRQPNTARYNAEGRIVSRSNDRVSSRGTSRGRVQDGSSRTRRENGNVYQRSRTNNSERNGNMQSRRSTGRSNKQYNLNRSENRSGQEVRGRSSGNSNMRRSDVRTNRGNHDRRTNGNANVQRSSRRSSGNEAVRSQRNTSGYRQASPGSQSRKSYSSSGRSSDSGNAVRSSGNRNSGSSRSGIQRSPGRSNGNANTRRSGSSGRSGRRR